MKKLAFEYVISKKNRRRKKKQANYENLELAKYLQEDEFPIKEKQHLFQYRMEYFDVKANRNWKLENVICRVCNDLTKVETQLHVLAGTALIKKKHENIITTFIYQDLYSDHVEDQMYTSQA